MRISRMIKSAVWRVVSRCSRPRLRTLASRSLLPRKTLTPSARVSIRWRRSTRRREALSTLVVLLPIVLIRTSSLLSTRLTLPPLNCKFPWSFGLISSLAIVQTWIVKAYNQVCEWIHALYMKLLECDWFVMALEKVEEWWNTFIAKYVMKRINHL